MHLGPGVRIPRILGSRPPKGIAGTSGNNCRIIIVGLRTFRSVPQVLFHNQLKRCFVSISQASRCSADPDCGVERFCLASHQQEPVCATCRGVRRHCVREAMCCSGNHCLNSNKETCPMFRPDLIRLGIEPGSSLAGEARARTPELRDLPQFSINREGESCLRTSDCSTGLCCARHFWSKICRPVLKEGQVCSKRGRKEAPQGPEIFQRCDCAPGLTCRHQNQDTSQRRSRLRVCQGT
uniref:Dickkopf WNT signaling pathway inhibitor 4 n=1 Tax=Callorhinchus milii TaxID=7868 RepID=A0A4W3IRM0_CALMI